MIRVLEATQYERLDEGLDRIAGIQTTRDVFEAHSDDLHAQVTDPSGRLAQNVSQALCVVALCVAEADEHEPLSRQPSLGVDEGVLTLLASEVAEVHDVFYEPLDHRRQFS